MLRTNDIIRYDALSSLWADLERQMNDMWATVDITFPCPVIVGSSAFPKLDADVEDDKYIVRASVPGFELDELSAEITEQKDGPILTISGHKTTVPESGKNARSVIHEIKQSRFSRTLLLPKGTYGNITAALKNGILTLEIPKPVEQIPQKIKIDIK